MTNPTVSDAVITLTDILSEGVKYMAKATIPQKVNIDSLTCLSRDTIIFSLSN